MSSDDLPTWVHYAQALVVPVVTAAGIGIAWGQLSLARRRMQLDLYDRRYKIFESARRLIAEIMRDGRSEIERIYAYHRETGDAIFLLDRDAVTYINELEQRAFRLRRLGVITASEKHVNRDAPVDEEAKLIEWFTGQFDVLVEKFKPSLQLKRRWFG
jgi:hypothetical protein